MASGEHIAKVVTERAMKGSALEQQVAESGASKASGPGPLASEVGTDAAETVPGPVGVHPATVDPYEATRCEKGLMTLCR